MSQFFSIPNHKHNNFTFKELNRGKQIMYENITMTPTTLFADLKITQNFKEFLIGVV